MRIKEAIIGLKEDKHMLGIVDFFEPIVKGEWKFVGGMALGVLVLILFRVISKLWTERQITNDIKYVESHLNVPIDSLKKKVWFILVSIILLLLIILPVSLWITVEILKSVKDINPGIALLFVLCLCLILTMIISIQTVRLRRLNRRIKLLQKNV
jgi:hypothetical protein